jgi:uncharacterized protein (TIGR03067 family)
MREMLMANPKVRGILLVLTVFSCGLLAGWLPGAVADDSKKAKAATVKKDLELLQGTWHCVGLEMNGQRIEGQDYRDRYGPNPITIKGNKLSVGMKKPIVCTFTLDPTKSPKWIDSTRQPDGLKLFGIYELKEGRLMLFKDGGKRPTAFRTKAGKNEVFHIYEKK